MDIEFKTRSPFHLGLVHNETSAGTGGAVDTRVVPASSLMFPSDSRSGSGSWQGIEGEDSESLVAGVMSAGWFNFGRTVNPRLVSDF